jgi:aspartyl-tRNA(Asn)/glutamyl-tRNA(Gln) amidotransferase subunit C
MIGREEVEHVAWLARLELSEEEKERFSKQLGQVLEHASKIKEVDTSDVLPTSHSLPLKNVFREDKVEESLSQEETLANAPKKEKGAFLVPKII